MLHWFMSWFLLLTQIPQGGITASGAAPNTNFAVVQHKFNSCSNGVSCSITVNSTGAGNILVVWVGNLHASTTHINSITNGGTYTQPTNHSVWDANGAGGADMRYTLNSSSGATSITISLTAADSNWFLGVIELSSATAASFDTSASNDPTTCNATTCAGVALTLGGTNDAICQLGLTTDGSISSVNSPWSTNADFDTVNTGDAQACRVNTNSGTAPTWTQAASGNTPGLGIAFND